MRFRSAHAAITEDAERFAIGRPRAAAAFFGRLPDRSSLCDIFLGIFKSEWEA